MLRYVWNKKAKFVDMRIGIILFVMALAHGLTAQISEEVICAEKARFEHINEIRKRSGAVVFHGYDVKYHRCHWKLNPKVGSNIYGAVLFDFFVDANSDSLAFDLVEKLQVDSVKQGVNHLNWERKGDRVLVYNAKGWKGGTRDSFEVFYGGNPIGVTGNNGAYSYEFHATGPIISTLSQPYGAPYWWPCKQTLNDKIDSIDIIVDTDKDFKVGTNGLLLSTTPLNATEHRVHWKHRYPVVTYLIAIAVSNYEESLDHVYFHNRPDSLPVLNYVFPQFLSTASQEAKGVLPMLRLYDSLFIPYPFPSEKYGHAQFTWGGGMEHQTMSFMVNFSYDLMAHEVAHQWFGDMVTCGSWNDLWLNEGFATYLTALAYEFLKSKEEFRFQMRIMRNNITQNDNGAVKPSDTSRVNVLFNGRLTYRKGAWLLHMLRHQVGDSMFFEGCRQFLTGGNRAYGFSTTDEFRQVMEAVSGQDLKWFITQWYEGQGHPELKMNWQQRGNTVMFSVQQTPSNPTVPFWRIPIPVEFQNSEGKSERKVFYPDSLSKNYTFSLPFAADTAIFDPEVSVLAKFSIGGMNLDAIQQEDIVLQPNPGVDFWNLYARNPVIQRVEVYNAVGQRVWVQHLDSALSVRIDTRFWPSGTYITKIYTDNFVYSKKCLKID
jgi:aminopeptidase N